MKHALPLLVSAVALLFSACTADEVSVPDTTPSTTIKADEMASVKSFFPEDDGSKALTGKPQMMLKRLVKAMDPQRAMSREMLEITDQQFAEIKAKADEICASCTTPVAKITALTKWVKQNVKYTETDNNAYAVLKSLKGVCQGYSNLLHAMLLSQDLPCIGVNGYLVQWADAPIEFNPAHAWVYACDGKSWYVCDPTNSETKWAIDATTYTHLQPAMCDCMLYEDDDFAYNFYDMQFNVCRVKRGESELVLPFGALGYQVASFNPDGPIPTSIRTIYFGKNITSIGKPTTIIGLLAYRSFDEMCYVDPANPALGSANGVIYKKESGKLTSILYIPSMMTSIELLPIEKVEKNTILGQKGVEQIVFVQGTKVLESYAIEDCPNLRTVYIPEGCTLEPDAIYNCPKNVEVVTGFPTGIKPVML